MKETSVMQWSPTNLSESVACQGEKNTEKKNRTLTSVFESISAPD
jgi:hypothetical protein